MRRLPYQRVSLFGMLTFAAILGSVVAIEAHLQGGIALDRWRLWDRGTMFNLFAITPQKFTDMASTHTVDWDVLCSLITYGFFHVSWGHVAFNMIPFAILGWLTLRRVGTVRFLGVYFGVMVLAALAYIYGATAPWLTAIGAGSPSSRLMGASGAVHGLGGAWVIWAFADRQGQTLQRIWPSLAWLAFIVAVNGYLYVQMNGGFAWSLHIAGVMFGMTSAPLVARQ